MLTIPPFRSRSCWGGLLLGHFWVPLSILEESRCCLAWPGILPLEHLEKIVCLVGPECRAVTTVTVSGSVWEDRQVCLDSSGSCQLRRLTGRPRIAPFRLRSA